MNHDRIYDVIGRETQKKMKGVGGMFKIMRYLCIITQNYQRVAYYIFCLKDFFIRNVTT